MTEETEMKEFDVLYYDNECSFCRGWERRVRGFLLKREIKTSPFMNGGEEEEMLIKCRNGASYGGASAIIYIVEKIWWLRPFVYLLRVIPGAEAWLGRGYQYIAKRRSCLGGSCKYTSSERSGKPERLLAWVVLLCLVGAAFISGHWLAPWAWMWALAGAMWLGYKLLMLSCLEGWRQKVIFLFWVGMDAKSFSKNKERGVCKRSILDVWKGLGTIIFGVFVVWYCAPKVTYPVVQGWLCMGGIVMILHFGLFRIMAYVWNCFGYPVTPIMQAPWVASRLSEFWSQRWNRAFSDVIRLRVFRPVSKRCGVKLATFCGFFVSGIAHELVISVPARGGYGLPLLYFLIQLIGVLLERYFRVEKHWFQKVFTFAFLILPAFLLFHPPFMQRVLLPFLEIIRAI